MYVTGTLSPTFKDRNAPLDKHTLGILLIDSLAKEATVHEFAVINIVFQY